MIMSVCCPLAVTSPLLCSVVSSDSDLVVSVPRLRSRSSSILVDRMGGHDVDVPAKQLRCPRPSDRKLSSPFLDGPWRRRRRRSGGRYVLRCALDKCSIPEYLVITMAPWWAASKATDCTRTFVTLRTHRRRNRCSPARPDTCRRTL